jgi:predicted O-methyltransferase YrrM
MLGRLLPSPGSPWQYSMIHPYFETNRTPPAGELIDLAIQGASKAREINLEDLGRRNAAAGHTNIWPGEHYRLLAAFMQILNPALVIEVGTYTGISALAMKKFLPDAAKLITFDVIPWKQIPDVCLTDDDFKDGRMVQMIGDLADSAVMNQHSEMMSKADIIFCDAPKDGIFEPKFIANLSRVKFVKPPLVIFDDIRVWNMLQTWNEISMPKLDVTSFGHWSGTGLVRWQNR